MSNLLKSNFVVCDEKAKVIDYNDLIEERLKEFNQKKHESDAIDGFVPGLEFKEVAVTEEFEETQIIEDPLAIIEEAKAEAERILTEANQQASLIKQQAMDEGKKIGYNEGSAKAFAEFKKKGEELNQKSQQLDREYQKKVKEMEPHLLEMLIQIVEHVLPIEIMDKKDIILHLLEGALGNINISNDFIIRVSKDDYAFVKERRSSLEQWITKNANIELVEDICLGKNQCMIETDGGIFDCSLDVQLENHKKAILLLARQN